MNGNWQEEAEKTIKNAEADYRAHRITAEQFREITRIPMKDLIIVYEMGHLRTIIEPTIIYMDGKKVIVDPQNNL